MNNFFEVELFVERDLEFLKQLVFLWSFKLVDYALEKARDFYSLCRLDVSGDFSHQLLLTEMIGISFEDGGLRSFLLRSDP